MDLPKIPNQPAPLPQNKETPEQRAERESQLQDIIESINLGDLDLAREILDHCKKEKIAIDMSLPSVKEACLALMEKEMEDSRSKKPYDTMEMNGRFPSIVKKINLDETTPVCDLITFCIQYNVKINFYKQKDLSQYFDQIFSQMVQNYQYSSLFAMIIESENDFYDDLEGFLETCEIANIKIDKSRLQNHFQNYVDNLNVLNPLNNSKIRAINFCRDYKINLDLKTCVNHQISHITTNLEVNIDKMDQKHIDLFEKDIKLLLEITPDFNPNTTPIKTACQKTLDYLLKNCQFDDYEEFSAACARQGLDLNFEIKPYAFYVAQKTGQIIDDIAVIKNDDKKTKNNNYFRNVHLNTDAKKLSDIFEKNEINLRTYPEETAKIKERFKIKLLEIIANLEFGNSAMSRNLIYFYSQHTQILNLEGDSDIATACTDKLRDLLFQKDSKSLDTLSSYFSTFHFAAQYGKIDRSIIVDAFENHFRLGDKRELEGFSIIMQRFFDPNSIELDEEKIIKAFLENPKIKDSTDYTTIKNIFEEWGIDLISMPDNLREELKQKLKDTADVHLDNLNIFLANNVNYSLVQIAEILDLAEICKIKGTLIDPKKINQENVKMNIGNAIIRLARSKDYDLLMKILPMISSQNLPIIEALKQSFELNLFYQQCKNNNPDLAQQPFFTKNGFAANKIYEQAYDAFGDFLTENIVEMYELMEIDEMPDEMRELGIKHTGKRGVAEIKEAIARFRRELLTSEINPNLRESDIKKQLLKKMARVDSSEWKHLSHFSFDEVINAYFALQNQCEPLKKEFKPSEILRIDKTDQEKQKSFVYSEAFLTRYNQLLNSLEMARQSFVAKKEDGLQDILDQLIVKINLVKEELQSKLDLPEETVIAEAKEKTGQEPSRIELDNRTKNLQKRLALLDEVLNDTTSGPQIKFNILRQFKGEFDEGLRQLMFFFGYFYNQDKAKKNLSQYEKTRPPIEEITWVMNFIDHIVNQETLHQYFTDKKAAKEFNGLLHIGALEQEMARLQNIDTAGTMTMQFVPTRNILTELSGHIADACWAGKNVSVLDQFPNFTSLIMVQNPGNKDEKYCGAAFLIEAESENGEPLLIIRGLNPQENTINQLNQKDYCDKLFDYLRKTAEKMGRKLAIVVDWHAGGSGTNRRVLYQYLNNLKNSLPKVILASAEKTTFNTYNIVNDCFLL